MSRRHSVSVPVDFERFQAAAKALGAFVNNATVDLTPVSDCAPMLAPFATVEGFQAMPEATRRVFMGAAEFVSPKFKNPNKLRGFIGNVCGTARNPAKYEEQRRHTARVFFEVASHMAAA